MHFLKLSALVLPLLAGVMAAPAPAPEPAAAPQPYREEAAPGQEEYPTEPPKGAELPTRSMDKRGFGCPFNAYECSDHVSRLSDSFKTVYLQDMQCRGLGGGRSGAIVGGGLGGWVIRK